MKWQEFHVINSRQKIGNTSMNLNCYYGSVSFGSAFIRCIMKKGLLDNFLETSNSWGKKNPLAKFQKTCAYAKLALSYKIS